MKLPFSFGIKLVFRLILPGIILAAGFAPIIHTILIKSGIPIKLIHTFPFEIVFWGWLIVLLDMQIYMLFEGRRYWPQWILKIFRWLETKRLDRLQKASSDETRKVNHQKYLEANIELIKFRIDGDGEPEVQYPTRLGNLIAAYESYSIKKYELDPVFYWYRIWVNLDKDLREEIDSQQAIVDSAVYVPFSIFVFGVCLIFYALVGRVSSLQIVYLPSYELTAVFGLVAFAVGFVIYRGSLHAHAQFGELFKSIFDQHRSKISFDDILRRIGEFTGDPLIDLKSEGEKYRIVSRYLRWHRIRPAGEKKNWIPEKWLLFQEAGANSCLAERYYKEGKYDEAEPLYKRALEMMKKSLGPDHPDVAQTLENYAALLRKTGRGDEAAKMEARAEAIRAKHAEQNPVK